MSLLGPVLATVGLCLFLTTWAADTARGPVSRRRLERFAFRQRLAITPTNGDRVIVYLATVRRWRTAGLTVGLVASMVWSLGYRRVDLNVLALFAGWFAGAVVAEIRVASLNSAGPRAAMLAPRRLLSYLSPIGWLFHLLVVGASVAAAVTAVAVSASRSSGPPALAVAVWAVFVPTILVVVGVSQRRVLHRAQPFAAADVIAADDAIRSRSLHVLTTGGAALALFFAAQSLTAVDYPLGSPEQGTIQAATGLAAFAVPVLALAIATSSWSVRRPLLGQSAASMTPATDPKP